MDFPAIPAHKKYNNNRFTPEQEAFYAAIHNKNISKKNDKVLRECRDFYLRAYKALKKVDLSKITEKDAVDIKKYLKEIFNFRFIARNNVYFKYLYRITIVRDNFLEDDKVRLASFISYPPLDLVRELGFYGRANTSNSTVLYCSFHPNIALMEIKPEEGQRIIISEWYKESDDPFVSYPIYNEDITINEGLVKFSESLLQTQGQLNEQFGKIFKLYFHFIGSEFVKSIPITNPKRFEYLYSAYFADLVLESPYAEGDLTPRYDCIIYPSIAAKHQTDNVAIWRESVERLRPIFMEDCIVVKTHYDEFDIQSQKSVIDRAVIRSSEKIEDGRIIWSDD